MEKYFYSTLVPAKNTGKAQTWLTTLVRQPTPDEEVQPLIEQYLSTRDGALLYPLVFDLLKLKKSLDKVQECISDRVSEAHDDYIFSLRELVVMLLHMHSEETTQMICTLLIQNSIPLPLLLKSSGEDNTQPEVNTIIKDVLMDLAIYPVTLALKVGDSSYGCSRIIRAAFHLSPKISFATGSMLHSPSIDLHCPMKDGCVEYQRIIVETNGWSDAPVFFETIESVARISMFVVIQYKKGDGSLDQLKKLIGCLKNLRPNTEVLLIRRDVTAPDPEVEKIMSVFPKAKYHTVRNISNDEVSKKQKAKLVKIITETYETAKEKNSIIPSAELPAATRPPKKWLTSFLEGLYSEKRADSTKIHELSRKRVVLKQLLDLDQNMRVYNSDRGPIAMDPVKLKKEREKLYNDITNIKLGPETMGLLQSFERWNYFNIWQCGHALCYWFKKSQNKLLAQLDKAVDRKNKCDDIFKGLEKEKNLKPLGEWQKDLIQKINVESENCNAILKEIEAIEEERAKHAITTYTLIQEVMEAACHTQIMEDPDIARMIKGFITIYANQMFTWGYPLQFIRGEQLVMESDFIEDVFKECQEKLHPKRLSVVTIIGRQSTGKSTLINAMFGGNFLVNSERCTVGMYCSLYHAGNGHYILVFDSEGLMLMRTRDDVFDKYITIFALLISDIVIYNKREAIGAQEVNLFQMAGLGAKLFRLPDSKRDIPTMIFALRDQDPATISAQRVKVQSTKAMLQTALTSVDVSLSDCVNIDSENIFLFPQPTEKSDGAVIASDAFALGAMKLRSYLIDQLEKIPEEKKRTNLLEFYQESVALYRNVTETEIQVMSFESLELRRITESAKKLAIEIFDHSDFPKHAIELVNEFDVKAVSVDPNKIDVFKLSYTTRMETTSANIAQICCDKFEAEATTKKIPDKIKLENSSYLRDQFFKSTTFYCKILDVYTDQYISKNRANAICEALNKKIEAVKENDEAGIARCKREIEDEIKRVKEELKWEGLYISRGYICKHIEKQLQSALDRVFNEDIEMASIKKLTDTQIASADAIDFTHWFSEERGVAMGSARMNAIYQRILGQMDKRQKELFGPLNDHKKLPQEMTNMVICIMRFVETICKVERTDTYELNEKILRADVLQMYMNRLADYLYMKEECQFMEGSFTRECVINNAYQKLIMSLDMKNSARLNESLANIIHEEISKSLIESELKRIQLYVKDEIEKEFPNPEALIRYAFHISFEEGDPEKTFKYIRDTPKFITDAFTSILDKHLQSFASKPQKRLRTTFKNIMNIVISKISNKTTTSLTLRDALKDDARLSIYTFIFPDVILTNLEDLKMRLLKIDNIKILINPEEEKKLHDEITKINGSIKVEIGTIVSGCQAICPMCGAKCKLGVNHKNPNHKALHQLCAFAGWKNNWLATPILEPCATALKQVLYGKSGEEMKMEDLFKKRFRTWQMDLDSPEMIASQYILKRGWVRVHLPLLREFKMRRFVPPELEPEIRDLEKMPVGYAAPGYNMDDEHTPLEKTHEVLVDTVFLMDCTGSMSCQIEQCKKTIKDLITLLLNASGAKMRAAFVGYRDHCDPKLILYKGFTESSNIEDLITFINTQVCADGGGDVSEAVADGLQYVLKEVPWNPSAVKFIYHIFDAPPHGRKYDCALVDDHPDGCPCGVDPNNVLMELRKMSDLQFCMICCRELEQMVSQFKSVFPEILVVMLADAKKLTLKISDVMLKMLG
ncbi:MAG: hypothetical protein P4M11_12825 [Candidatus Pacebacteria bacterium]|nr:hypothetical protein [Candidatus Paceibacterota bacterium]